MLDVFIAIIGGGWLLFCCISEMSKNNKINKRYKEFYKLDNEFRQRYVDKSLEDVVSFRLSKDKDGVIEELSGDLRVIYGDSKPNDYGFLGWYDSFVEMQYLGTLLLSRQGKYFSPGLDGLKIGRVDTTGIKDIAFCKQIESNLQKAGANIRLFVAPKKDVYGKYDYKNISLQKVYPEHYIDKMCPDVDKRKCRLW